MSRKILISGAKPVLFIAAAFLMNACGKNQDGREVMGEVCFESQVLPIFQANCAAAGCHDGSGVVGISFVDYKSIRKHVVPENPASSGVYRAISRTSGNIMPPPPRKPLSQEQIALIKAWIEQGANNPTCK